MYETAGGDSGWRVGAHQLSAYASCAKHLGLPIELVLRAASTNKLGALIEKRKGSGRNVEKRNLTRIGNLYRRREDRRSAGAAVVSPAGSSPWPAPLPGGGAGLSVHAVPLRPGPSAQLEQTTNTLRSRRPARLRTRHRHATSRSWEAREGQSPSDPALTPDNVTAKLGRVEGRARRPGADARSRHGGTTLEGDGRPSRAERPRFLDNVSWPHSASPKANNTPSASVGIVAVPNALARKAGDPRSLRSRAPRLPFVLRGARRSVFPRRPACSRLAAAAKGRLNSRAGIGSESRTGASSRLSEQPKDTGVTLGDRPEPLTALRVSLTTGRDCGEPPRESPSARPSSGNSQPGGMGRREIPT